MSTTTKEKILPTNLLGLKNDEYYSEDKKVKVIVNNGLITCKSETGILDVDEKVIIPLINDITLDGTYNYSIQNIKKKDEANGYPTIFLLDTSGKNIESVYGTGSISNKILYFQSSNEEEGTETTQTEEPTTVTIDRVKISFAKDLSFDLSFNLMLQEGTIKKAYVPYDNAGKAAYWADHNCDAVNPKLFGAVGDGETDDTLALQTAFDYAINNNMKMVLDSGSTYLISDTLNIKGPHLYFDGQGATIKMKNDIPMIVSSDGVYKIDNMITINTNAGITNNGVDKENGISVHNNGTYYHRVFKNVIIDCNVGTAKTALNIETGGRTHYSNIQIYDPASYGFIMAGGNEAVIDNIYATRSKVKDRKVEGEGENAVVTNLDRESVGIKINASDHYIHDCVTIDFKTGFQSSGADNHFARCHVWVTYTPSIISKSISFEVKSGYATFSQCIADSTRYGWVLRGTAKVFISNCCNNYNEDYRQDIYGEPLLFYFDKGEKDAKNAHKLKGAGLNISSSYFKTVDVLNCHFDNLTEGENKIIIDKLHCDTFSDVHISEAVRTNDLQGVGLIINK